MAVHMIIGIIYPHESKSGIGHVACTLGGVNYESRGGRGCLKGSAARAATNPLFRHHFHRKLTTEQARRAKNYADACVGQPYVWGGVPTKARGGDCSGYMSGIIWSATHELDEPVRRLFATSNWKQVHDNLGFAKGLGTSAAPTPDKPGVLDRPYPGTPVGKGSKKADHVKWIQARLNFAGQGKHSVLNGKPLKVDGKFGDNTVKVVKAFQKNRKLQGTGSVGPKTWKLLNDIR